MQELQQAVQQAQQALRQEQKRREAAEARCRKAQEERAELLAAGGCMYACSCLVHCILHGHASDFHLPLPSYASEHMLCMGG